MPDGVEVTAGLDPLDAADDAGLTDGDMAGLSDADEGTGDTDPADGDTDGLTDGAEVLLGTDPTKADTDGDGLPDDNATPEGRGTNRRVEFVIVGGPAVQQKDTKATGATIDR